MISLKPRSRERIQGTKVEKGRERGRGLGGEEDIEKKEQKGMWAFYNSMLMRFFSFYSWVKKIFEHKINTVIRWTTSCLLGKLRHLALNETRKITGEFTAQIFHYAFIM